MSKFILTLNSEDIARQVASLINTGDQLWIRMYPESILRSSIQYLIELDGEKVIGVIGLEKQGLVTELKHLSVHPDYRKKGIGKKLLEKGIEAAKTNYVYGLVGDNNTINIRNNFKVGMKPIGKKMGRGRYLIIFARNKNGQRVYSR